MYISLQYIKDFATTRNSLRFTARTPFVRPSKIDPNDRSVPRSRFLTEIPVSFTRHTFIQAHTSYYPSEYIDGSVFIFSHTALLLNPTDHVLFFIRKISPLSLVKSFYRSWIYRYFSGSCRWNCVSFDFAFVFFRFSIVFFLVVVLFLSIDRRLETMNRTNVETIQTDVGRERRRKANFFSRKECKI